MVVSKYDVYEIEVQIPTDMNWGNADFPIIYSQYIQIELVW